MSKTAFLVLLSLCSWCTFAALPAPDFKLEDVGNYSARRGAKVSPRDYLFQISAYYFGDAG